MYSWILLCTRVNADAHLCEDMGTHIHTHTHTHIHTRTHTHTHEDTHTHTRTHTHEQMGLPHFESLNINTDIYGGRSIYFARGFATELL